MSADELDKLIRASLHGEPSDAQVARLQRYWAARSQAERRRRTLWRVAAAAATLAAVAAATWRGDRPEARRETPAPPTIVATPSRIEPMDPAPSVASMAQPVGREPTAYERLAFALQTRPAPSREQALAAQLQRAANDDERRRAIRQLGEGRSLQSLLALLRAAERPSVREDALTAVERIVGGDQLAAAVRQARDPRVRAALAQRLLVAPRPEAVHNFLALAADPATRKDALTAAAATDELPIAALVAALDGDDRPTRLAAALVLGGVNGPAVSAALIARVTQAERAPVEAWVALLACRGEAVDRFLAGATRQPRMLGQVNNARAYWARMVP